MSLISFLRPDLLFLLLLIPLIIIIHIVSLMAFKKKAMKFANFETIKRLTDEKEIFSKNIIHLLIRIFYILLVVLGIAGMNVELKETGTFEEILFAVDSSGSMLAADIEPNRLQATKTAIESFVGNATLTAPISLVTFTSLVFVEVEPTRDKLVFMSGLDSVAIRKTSGTSIGNVINYAPNVFDDKKNEKALVIFTDGQENILSKEELRKISQYANQKNIRIYLIGVATSEGGPIANETIGPSVLNDENLKLIAETNGGDYYTVIDPKEIPAKLNQYMEPKEVKKIYELSFYLFMASFVILIIEWYFANYFSKPFPS